VGNRRPVSARDIRVGDTRDAATAVLTADLERMALEAPSRGEDGFWHPYTADAAPYARTPNLSASPTPDAIAYAYENRPHGTATVGFSILSGEPWNVSHVTVIHMDGDTLTYTRDGLWYSTVTRSRTAVWSLDRTPAPREGQDPTRRVYSVRGDITADGLTGDEASALVWGLPRGFRGEVQVIGPWGTGERYTLNGGH
jgi:hypothetical protein